MQWHRLLSPDLIRMELETPAPTEEPGTPQERQSRKEAILKELVDLLALSGKISNPTKLLRDLRNRERKATTGIGGGVAVPHVRTRQAREFVMVLARSKAVMEFDSIDGEKVHLLIAMVAPPYEDRAYLRVYQKVGRIFSEKDAMERILQAENEHEIIRILTVAS